jgi:hypothetical protein
MSSIKITDADGVDREVDARANPDGTFQQEVVVADIPASMLDILQTLAYLVAAVDPTNGRLRTAIEANSTTNQSSNVAQINGVTPLMGAGATGTGSQRVTLANNVGLDLLETARTGTIPFDIMHDTWANAIRPRIT